MKVRALKQLTFKTSKGKVTVKPGQVFKPAEPEKLINAGLAESVKLPPGEVGRPYWQRPNGSCRVCNYMEVWTSIYNVTVCARCHPSAHEKLVEKVHGNC